jgi:hypothetical protein
MDRRSILRSAAALALLALPGTALAQGTIKIGVILPYSGQFADFATQIDNGIKLYMKQKGDTVAGKKIELIRKDTGGVAPDWRRSSSPATTSTSSRACCSRPIPSPCPRSRPRPRSSW